MTITTTKWTLILGKTPDEKLKLLDNERLATEQRLSVEAKRIMFEGEAKLLKLHKEYQSGGDSYSYANCSFGQPFPVQIPVPMQPIAGTDEGALEYAVTQTGVNKEIIQRIWESIRQYFQDKNKP